MIDVPAVKLKIVKFLEEKGPSLPMQLAKATELSSVFASAILAELLDEKRIKTSSLRIGSSPLYLLYGQEQKLEDFQDNIQGIQKEALLKLKQKKVLKDETQIPSIRVALRSIKDFAVPIKYKEQVYWKYAFISQDELQEKLENKKIEEKREESKDKIIKQEDKNETKKEQRLENIFETKEKSAKSIKSGDKFLGAVQEYLSATGFELVNIEAYNKKEAIIKARKSGQEIFVFAYNKKRITDLELVKAYRKTNEMSYIVLTRAEPAKKMQEIIDACKHLVKITSFE